MLLLACFFGVSFSTVCLYVHILGSVKVAELPSLTWEIAAPSAYHMFCLYRVYLLFRLFPILVSRTEFEPRREKTGFLHMRKQRRRSASR